jgi:hypothetical protein
VISDSVENERALSMEHAASTASDMNSDVPLPANRGSDVLRTTSDNVISVPYVGNTDSGKIDVEATQSCSTSTTSDSALGTCSNTTVTRPSTSANIGRVLANQGPEPSGNLSRLTGSHIDVVDTAALRDEIGVGSRNRW